MKNKYYAVLLFTNPQQELKFTDPVIYGITEANEKQTWEEICNILWNEVEKIFGMKPIYIEEAQNFEKESFILKEGFRIAEITKTVFEYINKNPDDKFIYPKLLWDSMTETFYFNLHIEKVEYCAICQESLFKDDYKKIFEKKTYCFKCAMKKRHYEKKSKKNKNHSFV